jgi:hypothetical protein
MKHQFSAAPTTVRQKKVVHERMIVGVSVILNQGG